MSIRLLRHARAAFTLFPAVTAALLLAACRSGDPASPEPVPLPAYDLIFEETVEEGLQSDRLMVRRLDESAATPLFGTSILGVNPSPSADGTRVVFVSSLDPSADDYQDLFLMRRGVTPQRIPLTVGIESSPTVSPDGARVAYIKRGEDNVGRLYVARVEGGNEQALTIPTPPGTVTYYSTPAWSPDGSTILFSAGQPGNLHLYTVGSDGAGSRQITSLNAGSDTEGTWSPDGRSVAFVRGSSLALTSIVIRQLNTGAERTLPFPWRNRSPSWSPDGERIAFASNMADNLDFELYVVRVDGSDLQRLTDDELQQRSPRWIRR